MREFIIDSRPKLNGTCRLESYYEEEESVLSFVLLNTTISVLFSTMSSVSDQIFKRKGGKKYRQQLNREAAAKRWKKTVQESTCELQDRRYVPTISITKFMAIDHHKKVLHS
jgi:hypothetical protein